MACASAASRKENQRVLYVVLHGLISLLDTGKNGFCAYMLEIGEEHDYLFGDWLAERRIPKAHTDSKAFQAELAGVTAGEAQLDSALNPTVQCSVLPAQIDGRVRATVDLPRPRAIHQFATGEIPEGALSGKLTNLVQNPTHISGVRIFEYAFESHHAVVLRNNEAILWSCPDLARMDGQDCAVLHFYDEPGRKLSDAREHTLREFNCSAAFLGAELTLTQDIKIGLKQQGVPPGMLRGEVAALAERGSQVNALLLPARMQRAVPVATGSGGGSPVCGALNALLWMAEPATNFPFAARQEIKSPPASRDESIADE